MLITLLVFLLILSVLVFVHELGHFLAARAAGVRVEEFAFGFRPRLFAKKIGETTYAINLIPLGGYVRMYGEDDSQKGPRSYRSKTIAQRFLILIAGSTMNLLLGWILLSFLFAFGFHPLFPGVGHNQFLNEKPVVTIQSVSVQSPAEAAGLRSGDRVIAVDGAVVSSDQEFVGLVRSKDGRPIQLTVLDASSTSRILTVTPRTNPPAGEGALGIAIQAQGKVRTSVLLAPLAGLYETGRIIGLSLTGFVDFTRNLVLEQKVSEEVTGLVGIGAATGILRREGFEYLLQLVLLVSIGLGVVNLMPIMPLDGGHLAALAYEKLFGKPLSERQLGILVSAGLAFVLLIFVLVTYKDLVRFNVFDRIF